MNPNIKTKRTQQDRQRDLFKSCKETVMGHWMHVRRNRLTFAQHLAQSADMRKRLDYQGLSKLTRYHREALNAFDDALYHLNAWEKAYVHLHEGKIYLGFGELPEAGQEQFRKGEGLSAHVWPGPEVFDGADVATLKLWGEFSK